MAAGSYLRGGLLILARRWLWITAAAINALVIVFFVSLCLIVADWRRARRTN